MGKAQKSTLFDTKGESILVGQGHGSGFGRCGDKGGLSGYGISYITSGLDEEILGRSILVVLARKLLILKLGDHLFSKTYSRITLFIGMFI